MNRDDSGSGAHGAGHAALQRQVYESLVADVTLRVDRRDAAWLYASYITPLRLACGGGVGETLAGVRSRLQQAQQAAPSGADALELVVPRALAAELASWLQGADAFDTESASPRLVWPDHVERAHALGCALQRQLYVGAEPDDRWLRLSWRAALEYGQARASGAGGRDTAGGRSRGREGRV